MQIKSFCKYVNIKHFYIYNINVVININLLSLIYIPDLTIKKKNALQ